MNCPRVLRVLAITGGLLALLCLSGVPAYADGANAGAAVMVDPASNKPLSSGGSETVWSLALPKPPKSNCSGDSAHQAFFVYSYLVSDSVGPGSITFQPDRGLDPRSGKTMYPLVDSQGKPYISANTAVETGQVLPGTKFDFRRFSVDGASGAVLKPGTYNVGLACWNADRHVNDKFWNATVTFRASSTDPSGLVWRTAANAATTSSSGTSPVLAIVVVAAALLGGGLVMRRRSALREAGR